MWYSDGSHVWLAVSEDGLNWSVVGQSTGLADANHPKAIYDPDGFGGSGVYYKIWYWDTTKLYTVEAIRYAESADGLNWVNDQPLTQDAGRPIITGVPSDWNRGSYGPSHIFYNSSGSDEMNHSNPSGNKYVMYFDGTDGGFEETGLAYSNNGINWSMCCKVLERGGGPWGNNGTWDSSYAYAWSVVRSPVGYELWYSGGQKASHEGIGHAVSSDGMNFTKDAANPIQSLARQPGAWNAERSYTPMVLYDANNFSGHGENSAYRMWFTGMASGNYAIGGARFTTSYPTSGAYLSPVFDAGARVSFVEINWSATFGNATAILLVTRTSDDGSNWSAWSAPHAYPLSPINASGRFIQFRAELSTSDPLLTPSLDEVRISYQGAPTGQSERAEGEKHFDIEIIGDCLLEPITFKVSDLRTSEPLQGAIVRVITKNSFWEEVAELSTDRHGSATFVPQRDGQFEASFARGGYAARTLPLYVRRCAECYADAECADDERCVNGECTEIRCPCGKIENRECVAFECCSDSDCPTDASCSDNRCVKLTGECGYAVNHSWVRYACCSDAECGGDEVCSNNACVKLTGECGYAVNHSWVRYACCSENDCKAGEFCLNHTCTPRLIYGALRQPGFDVSALAPHCAVILLFLLLIAYLLFRRRRRSEDNET